MSTTTRFIHQSKTPRIVFGRGRRREVAQELRALGVRAPLCVSSPGSAAAAAGVAVSLADGSLAPAATSDRARMHVPEHLVDEHMRIVEESGADSLVAVGGGSAIGLAKAVALRSGLPVVCLPTTYSGSEMTDVWGVTKGGEKRTGRDVRVLARVVVYDPELTDGLPRSVRGLSGLNAVAHAVEAIYAPDTSPLVAVTAGEAIAVMIRALRGLDGGWNERDRDDALYASWLCGVCLDSTRMGLHHRLCHLLGGRFDTPHAATHALVLPFVLRHQEPGLSDAQRELMARSVNGGDVCTELLRLARAFGAPSDLRALGVGVDDLAPIARRLAQEPPSSDGPIGEKSLLALLRSLHRGRLPSPIGPVYDGRVSH
ncbi:Maleylacetate reductase [Streptomyces sp. PRh5]|uniref:maleylacetate reductase n=1 Tax=Streptomyces sp. PRh5 TaxID=1158056 RepID=UPI00044AED8A|nr:maleylacetate reductase [Streptomyces sp. PRh5]EXU63683.1 Maleylacetate reductase [Streptomyces sp. PRh5]